VAIVTVGEVNDHLSNPPWSAAQEATCQELIDRRQTELRRWLGVPIEPLPMAETVRVLDSGLLATHWPVARVLVLDDVVITNGGLTGCELPAPYYWRDEHWISASPPVTSIGYTARPYSLLTGPSALPGVTLSYLGGWGPVSDLKGAIISKVAATMLNRHDDTVTARALDDKKPAPLKEEWTDKELLMVKSRRRPVGAR